MSIIIGGDICPTRDTKALFATGSGDTVFGNVAPLLRAGDVTIVNLECALTEKDTAIRKIGPNLKAPLATAKALKDVGVDICSLANNHVFDYGTPGLEDTLIALNQSDIEYIGIGENEADARQTHYFNYKGLCIGLIAVAEHEYSYALPKKCGVRGFDPFESVIDVMEAKKNCDRLIVLYHGGKEQCEYPSPRLRKACRAMAYAGADVVLCQHSHCIGVCEEYNNSYILYGQGNFHFVYADDPDPQWFSGLLLELDFAERPIITYHPIAVKGNSIALAEGEEKEQILNAFAERNALFADEEKAAAEWHKFCKSQEPAYRKVIFEALQSTDMQEEINEMFPHYLDCEAHTDVWRELFQTYHARNVEEC